MLFRLGFHYLFAVMLQGKFNSDIIDLSIQFLQFLRGFIVLDYVF